VKQRTNVLFLATLMFISSCGKLVELESALGHQEHRNPLTIDLLLDASLHSTGSPETLRGTLDAIIPYVAARPGSAIRLWTLDEHLAARLVAQREVTSPKRTTPKAIIAHERRWTADTMDYLQTAAAPVFAAGPAQKSRIAEALTRIAGADAPTAERLLVYVGDMRETGVIRSECAPNLPDPQTFLARLHEQGLLLPKSMPYPVIFAYTSITTPSDVLCDTPARSLALQNLWRAALTSAGATPTFFITAPTLERSTS
jgi:hypothetical protein